MFLIGNPLLVIVLSQININRRKAAYVETMLCCLLLAGIGKFCC